MLYMLYVRFVSARRDRTFARCLPRLRMYGMLIHRVRMYGPLMYAVPAPNCLHGYVLAHGDCLHVYRCSQLNLLVPKVRAYTFLSDSTTTENARPKEMH